MNRKPALTQRASLSARRAFLAAWCVLLLTQALSALSVDAGFLRAFPESSEVRQAIFARWLSEDISRVLLLREETIEDRYGSPFTVRNAKSRDGGLLDIIVEPAQGRSGARGTWVLSRRLSDGAAHSISFYPTGNPRVYVSIKPDGQSPERGRSLLSLIVWGRAVRADVPVGVPLTALYTMECAEIVEMTRATVPWSNLSPNSDDYRDIRAMADTVRSRLGTLVYLEDGAFDEEGSPVLIASGARQDPQAVLQAAGGRDLAGIAGGVNCAGFAKWVVDGMIRPITGGGIKLSPLRDRTASPETHFTEPFRQDRDIFFALDWSRHLASAAASLYQGSTVRPSRSGVDVTIEPFSGANGYERNVGYRARDLKALLFWLASTEPGHLYLGAVSTERGNPLLREYHHLIVFMPFFDDEGEFSCAVFESAEETGLDNVMTRNLDAWVHLARIRASERDRYEP
jgi:hypothetical protein